MYTFFGNLKTYTPASICWKYDSLCTYTYS